MALISDPKVFGVNHRHAFQQHMMLERRLILFCRDIVVISLLEGVVDD